MAGDVDDKCFLGGGRSAEVNITDANFTNLLQPFVFSLLSKVAASVQIY